MVNDVKRNKAQGYRTFTIKNGGAVLELTFKFTLLVNNTL
jgi:hypothetical protein